MIATYRLVLLLAFHALKIATFQGSGAIIKDFCSRVLYDCDALGTALRYDGLLASIERKHKRIEDMARSTTSSRSGGAAASTTGRRSSGQRGRGQQGRGSASSGAIAAAAAAHAASAGTSGDILEGDINPNHATDIRETTAHEMDAETEKDHRRRQREIMEWIKKEYPEQHDHCVIELTAEQKSNPDNKYYSSTHDFVYERVNPTTIKAFLSSEKKYKDETRTTQYSHVHIRKCHD